MKIGHIINPFKCLEDNPSYLYYAQPITFESMKIAKDYGKSLGINIELYLTVYKEDEINLPVSFKRLSDLENSTLKYENIKKKLPFVQDILNKMLNETDCDYIILTNVDIGVQKTFYEEIVKIINNEKLDSFIINRRDNIPKFINGKRLNVNDLEIIYKEKGEDHPGKDCFIMSREILKKVNMGEMFIGYPPWGQILYKQLKNIDKNNIIFKNLYLTFHLGKDKNWKNDIIINNVLYNKNMEMAEKLGYIKNIDFYL